MIGGASLLNHLPLEDTRDDKLNLAEKAKEIASFVNYYPNNTPYAISVTGPWGSGKSTMLNFIETMLDHQKCLVIRFNPWMFSNKEELIRSLFEEVFYSMNGDNFTKAKNKFREYAQKIIPQVAKAIASFTAQGYGVPPQVIGNVTDAVSTMAQQVSNDLFDKPLSKRKTELEFQLKEILVETDEKIVIIIDELDRLFPDEVITVFQAIKSTLHFPGLFFIVAMDKITIYDGIEKAGISEPEKYLQKIFQREYVIKPRYQLRTLTFQYLLPEISLQSGEHIEDLKNTIDVFINLNEARFIKLIDDGKTINGLDIQQRQGVVTNLKYPSINQVLRSEFENPRVFLKLVDYITQYWQTFHEEVFACEQRTELNLQTSFLIFVAYFKYPSEIEPSLWQSWMEEGSPFISNMKSFFNGVFQEISGSNRRRNDSIVEQSVKVLNKFPDFNTRPILNPIREMHRII